MTDELFAFSATEVGYNHTKSGKVCEDASDYYDDGKLHICVVSDGHGSDNYPRTDKGSRFAVDATIKCVIEFVEKADKDDVLSDETNGYPVMTQLAKSILRNWHEAVDADYRDNPFTDEELKNVSDKYKQRYRSVENDERNVDKAYGCTLIFYAVTEDYSFGMQVGDGKCVVVSEKGDFTEPIPWDDNCQLNITTSICDSDSIDEFRYFITPDKPVAVFCGSDGIDDSYANSDEMYALYRSILKIFIDHGPEVGKSEIKEYLPVLTKKGSGDDVSIGLILNLPRVAELANTFDKQTKLFNLNERLKEKRQQLNSNVEKDNALTVRIKRWLDSGKTSTEDISDDNQRIMELRKVREEINTEIEDLEKTINEINVEEGLGVKTISVDLNEETKEEESQPVESNVINESDIDYKEIAVSLPETHVAEEDISLEQIDESVVIADSNNTLEPDSPGTNGISSNSSEIICNEEIASENE